MKEWERIEHVAAETFAYGCALGFNTSNRPASCHDAYISVLRSEHPTDGRCHTLNYYSSYLIQVRHH